MQKQITKEVVNKISELIKVNKADARRYVENYFGVSPRHARDVLNKIINEFIDSDTISYSGDANDLQEVLRQTNVDLTKWDVENYTISKKENKVETENGVEFKPKYEFNIKLKKKKIDIQEVLNNFIEKAREYAPKKFKFNKINNKKDGLYVLNIHDLHLASLVYKKETNFADYDINIAKNVYKEAVNELIAKAPIEKIEKVVVIAGSDYFNVDREGETFAGTRVDTDSRLSKIFSEGCDLLVEVINNLSLHFKVHVVVISGNHDQQTAYYLGAYLSAFYRKAGERIIIDNEPTTRKYVTHYNTIIGFDHGDKIAANKLPFVLLNERPDLANFKCKIFLTGHLHSDNCKEFAGISVRTSPSLSAYTKWASDMGFIGNIRCAQGLLFEKDHLSAIYYSTPVE